MECKIKGVQSGTSKLIPVSVDEDGNIYVIICGVQLDGTVTPVLVDATGKIILSS